MTLPDSSPAAAEAHDSDIRTDGTAASETASSASDHDSDLQSVFTALSDTFDENSAVEEPRGAPSHGSLIETLTMQLMEADMTAPPTEEDYLSEHTAIDEDEDGMAARKRATPRDGRPLLANGGRRGGRNGPMGAPRPPNGARRLFPPPPHGQYLFHGLPPLPPPPPPSRYYTGPPPMYGYAPPMSAHRNYGYMDPRMDIRAYAGMGPLSMRGDIHHHMMPPPPIHVGMGIGMPPMGGSIGGRIAPPLQRGGGNYPQRTGTTRGNNGVQTGGVQKMAPSAAPDQGGPVTPTHDRVRSLRGDSPSLLAGDAASIGSSTPRKAKGGLSLEGRSIDDIPEFKPASKRCSDTTSAGSSSPPFRSLPQSAVMPRVAGSPIPTSTNGGPAELVPYPLVYVSGAGTISCVLNHDVVVEMASDRSVRVVMHDGFAAVCNKHGTASAILHPAARILHNRDAAWAEFIANNEKMAVFGDGGILFTMSHLSEGYLVNSQKFTGANAVPLDQLPFPALDDDYTIKLFYSEAQTGPQWIPLCKDIVSEATYDRRNDGSLYLHINGMLIRQSSAGEVIVDARPRQISCNPKKKTIRIRSGCIDMAVEEEERGYVKRAHKRVHVSRSGMVVSDGNCITSMDHFGRIVCCSGRGDPVFCSSHP